MDEAAAALERFAAMESTGAAARARAHCSLGRICARAAGLRDRWDTSSGFTSSRGGWGGRQAALTWRG